jgi:hypothetical protein
VFAPSGAPEVPPNNLSKTGGGARKAIQPHRCPPPLGISIGKFKKIQLLIKF